MPTIRGIRGIRALFFVGATAIAVAGLAPAVAASTPHPLHITKDCSQYTGQIPSYCTITASNLPAIPAGTRVWYYGPVISSSVITSSSVVIKAGKNTATGYCQVDNRTGGGMCTFWKGTGALAGFHALVTVSAESDVVFHWDGRYDFS
jgi:hypothetical protein